MALGRALPLELMRIADPIQLDCRRGIILAYTEQRHAICGCDADGGSIDLLGLVS